MTRNQVNLKAPGAYTTLQRLALQLGYVQKGGPQAGSGSVAKMMEAIARGDLTFVPARDAGASAPSDPKPPENDP